MGRKAFNHFADVACRMFIGWRAADDIPRLVQLGTGTLDIDLLSAECTFNGERIKALRIAEELQAWMHESMRRHHIAETVLKHAVLTVNLDAASAPTGTVINANCTARLESGDGIYSKSVSRRSEWPGSSAPAGRRLAPKSD